MAVRFIVEGAVYILLARQALALARALRWLQSVEDGYGPPGDALAAAVLIEAALADEAPRAVEFTRAEAREVLRLVELWPSRQLPVDRRHALYRALRRQLGQPTD